MNLSQLTKNIFTPRLHITLMTAEHIPEIIDIYSRSFDRLRQFYSPEWSKKENLPPVEELQKMIEGWLPSDENPTGFSFCAYREQDGQKVLVGMGEFHHIDWAASEGRIGYWINTDDEGLGYASEISNALTRYIFERVGLQRLELRAEERNLASTRVADKLGFVNEGLVENDEGWRLNVYTRTNTHGLPDLAIRYQ